MATPSWVRATADGSVIFVHASPGARSSELAGLHGSALRVRIRARPVDGAANRELIAVLAKVLRVPSVALALRAGARGRDKQIVVDGLTPPEIVARLGVQAFVDKKGPRA